jgi:hypothetical protein
MADDDKTKKHKPPPRAVHDALLTPPSRTYADEVSPPSVGDAEIAREAAGVPPLTGDPAPGSPTLADIVQYRNDREEDVAAVVTRVHPRGGVCLKLFEVLGTRDLIDVPYAPEPRVGHWSRLPGKGVKS